MGGVTYTELIIKALRSLPHNEQPHLTLVFREHLINDPKSIELFAPLMPLVNRIALVHPAGLTADASSATPVLCVRQIEELSNEVDFLYPAHATTFANPANASWWPDFQHKHLPEYFDAAELNARDHALNEIASKAKCLVLSSADALNDFKTFYPWSKTRTEVLHFCNLPDTTVTLGKPEEVINKYNLPLNYFLCCNQFWIHKNHSLVFHAMAQANAAGANKHLVCTGQTADDRHPEYFQALLKLRTELRLEQHIHILGLIPRQDQQQLVRGAIAMIQPSLFEGWSTVVEDARAFGKTIFLSDIAVHLEQAPRHGLFYPRNDPVALAQLIQQYELPGGRPTLVLREQEGLQEIKVRAVGFGRSLMRIATDAKNLWC